MRTLDRTARRATATGHFAKPLGHAERLAELIRTRPALRDLRDPDIERPPPTAPVRFDEWLFPERLGG